MSNEQPTPFDEFERWRREWAKPLADRMQDMTETLRRSLSPAFEAQEAIHRLNEQLVVPKSNLLDPIRRAAEAARPALESASKAIQEAWDRAVPPNLHPLEDGRIWHALDVAASSGPCLIWAPRTEVVEELITHESFGERGEVLIAHREEVLADLAGTLEDANVTEVEAQAELHRFASAALAAANEGHDEAAQSLVGSALGCLVHGLLGHKQLADAREKMSQRDLNEAFIGQMRHYTIELATANALIPTRKNPEGFNRHGTQHGDPAFYGEAEMLSGLLLLVAWVRELSWWAEHDPRAFGENGRGGDA